MQTKDEDNLGSGYTLKHSGTVSETLEKVYKQGYAQSKTDLLNALIDREESKIKEQNKLISKGNSPEEAGVYEFAKADTINHLKSLRDE